MNQLQNIFNYQGQEVRTVLKNGRPWFVAKDVCSVLEISNVSLAVNGNPSRQEPGGLDDDEKGVCSVNTLGGSQELLCVTESGLYALVFKSRKPEAKAFKRWITHEVIPSIRKHGMYATDDLLENPDLLIEVATRLKEERAKRAQVEAQLQQQKPLVGFAESILASQDTVLVRDVAKIASKHGITIGQNRLYDKLREWKLIMQRSTDPMQKAVDAGYFEVVQGGRETSSGHKIFKTTRVTVKGQMYIIDRLKKESQLVLQGR